MAGRNAMPRTVITAMSFAQQPLKIQGLVEILGRLEADRGRRPEATRLLEEYLVRYPRGINGDDARALLQRLQ